MESYFTKIKAEKKGAKVRIFVSVAGGRNTMSKDIQRAAMFFGCDVLFHIAEKDSKCTFNLQELYDGKILSKEVVENYFPVIISKNIKSSEILQLPDIENELTSEKYRECLKQFKRDEFILNTQKSARIYEYIDSLHQRSHQTLLNFYYDQSKISKLQTDFRCFLQLPQNVLLKFGEDKPDIEWLKLLPKTDLHTHLGGFFTVEETMSIAREHEKEVLRATKQNFDFKEWYNKLKNYVDTEEQVALLQIFEKILDEEEKFDSIPAYIVTSGLLLAFDGKSSYLEQLLYGNLLEPKHFTNIGYRAYERLGNLQGSRLLKTKKSLQKASEIIRNHCNEQNIKYLELRCSHANYYADSEDFSSVIDVVNVLHDSLSEKTFGDNDDTQDYPIIKIIASRHREESKLDQHVNLMKVCLQDEKLKNFVAGFDIAGDESISDMRTPREKVNELLKACVRLTIHAGEHKSVDNIWDAVYELNADRMGHGLTLYENEQLVNKLVERKVFIELCLSSNIQIGNFQEKDYPLRYYYKKGLKAIINTDNRGISKTDISREYEKGANLACLNKADVLRILRNSVQAAFLSKVEKKKLMLKFENELFELLTRYYS